MFGGGQYPVAAQWRQSSGTPYNHKEPGDCALFPQICAAFAGAPEVHLHLHLHLHLHTPDQFADILPHYSQE